MAAEVFHRDALIHDQSGAPLIEDERWDPETQFDIEGIRDRRKRRGRNQYLLEFTGYPDHKDWSWTDEDQLYDENGIPYPLLVEFRQSIGGKNQTVCISNRPSLEPLSHPSGNVGDSPEEPVPMGEGQGNLEVIDISEDTVQAPEPQVSVRPKRKAKGKPKGRPKAKRSRKKAKKFG